jgi:diguanylate cyclase (GGDEF)-like protein
MKSYPVPDNETERQRDLDSFNILDTEPDEDFDRITRIASQMLGMPIALVSLVDHERQWFLSRVGLDATETAREVAFCAHTICSSQLMVVGDASADIRFRDNPLVTGDPHIRFYAGAPLRTRAGHALGTLCVIGSEPRELGLTERRLLEELAGMVIHTLESRRDRYLCPLTGFQNRLPFFEAGQREFQRAQLIGESLALVLIGLDDFASSREQLSGGQLNHLLKDIAFAISSELGPNDMPARVASWEFAILLAGRDCHGGSVLVDKIRSKIASQGMVVDGTRYILNISAGISNQGPMDFGFKDLYQRAESGLKQASLAGCNRTVMKVLTNPDCCVSPQQD